jgi:hypothetical protein
LANNGALYGIIGGLMVVVLGGGLYIAKENGALGPSSTTTAGLPPPTQTPIAPIPIAPNPAPAPPLATVPSPPPAATPVGPAANRMQQVRQLVGDTRRAIARGDLRDADRTLEQAARIDATSADVTAARRELAEAQQRAQHADNHVDALVAQARAAISRHDYAAADRLLDQAEHIDSRDRDVQQARAELSAAQRPGPAAGTAPGTAPGQGRR